MLDVLLTDLPVEVTSSIGAHLMKLLNARRGSLSHLPDYGLPDIGEIYQGLPLSLQRLKAAIIKLIEYSEPRLKDVKIFHHAIQDNDMVLHLQIYATMHNQKKISFDTYFLSGGRAIIRE